MEKLTAYQKKRLWLRLMTPHNTWKSHAEWATKQFGIEITEDEIIAFYTQRLTTEHEPAH